MGSYENTFRTIAQHPRPVLLVWGMRDTICPFVLGDRHTACGLTLTIGATQVCQRCQAVSDYASRHTPLHSKWRAFHPA